MKKKFVFMLIFAFGVEMYLSQDDVTMRGIVPPDPFGELEPFSFEDFKKPPEIDGRGKSCHRPNMKCLKGLDHAKQSPICAFVTNYGLVNFDNLCNINIQNCLVQPLDTVFVYGVTTKYDIVYHNGKKHDCAFYFKKAKNLENAIRLYHKTAYDTEDVTNNNLEDLDQY